MYRLEGNQQPRPDPDESQEQPKTGPVAVTKETEISEILYFLINIQRMNKMVCFLSICLDYKHTAQRIGYMPLC